MIGLKQAVESGIRRIIAQLEQDQSPNGSWDYPFDTGIKTDAYMIILLRSLENDDEALIQGLVGRILSKQYPNGAWKLFHDEEEGNLTTTVEAYYALLYSGYCTQDDAYMLDAERFIRSKGGIEKVGMFTRIMLALTGQLSWPNFPVPVEIMLLPNSSPINFYDFSVFGRANIAPILIVADQKYEKKTKRSPDLTRLVVEGESERSKEDEWRGFLSSLKGIIQKFSALPKTAHQMAIERAKSYMLSNLEPDGTFYSYFSATFLMIFALLSLGYRNDHPIITRALTGLKSMACEIDGFIHMQYTTANVWNTSLISYTLQEAGVPYTSAVVKKANDYLLSRQHTKFGDWVIHNPNTLPGGWGFSDINTINPDVDDTTASLRALRDMVSDEPVYRSSWYHGVKWALSMQNDGGGWPAFERNVDKKWIAAAAPVQGAEFLLLDPAAADLTGRTLEFFRDFTHLSQNHPAVKKGLQWLIKDQREDGSWYGRWGICYIYGTWAAMTGMAACRVKKTDTAVMRALDWLKRIQNDDGGWGESCKSDIQKQYVPLSKSTLTHTAWALDALILMEDEPTPEIKRGIDYLLRTLETDDWTTEYPKGQGMAAGFYIHYHSYRYIWPLLALSHFRNKFLPD